LSLAYGSSEIQQNTWLAGGEQAEVTANICDGELHRYQNDDVYGECGN
jgi:hypothetical protein